MRMWTVFLDEAFVRGHMRWVLGRAALTGTREDAWDGSALILRFGVELLHRAEPFWRQISVVGDTMPPEVATSRLISLFAGSVEALAPALVDPDVPPAPRPPFPVTGRLSSPMLNRSVQQAAIILRARMDELGTATRLTYEVSLSRAHLTRAFLRRQATCVVVVNCRSAVL